MLSYPTELYATQAARWPKEGRHILAAFTDDTVVVYQAYRRAIANAAVTHQKFGQGFSFSRMTWVKPNFLWMMYRSSWGTAENQETVLALHLRREGFDTLLRDAVYSSFVPAVYGDKQAWEKAVATSDVRLQWDPDHAPNGQQVARRAIQLGLRGKAVRRYNDEWIVKVEDVTAFVASQRDGRDRGSLVTPREDVYPVADAVVAARLGLGQWP